METRLELSKYEKLDNRLSRLKSFLLTIFWMYVLFKLFQGLMQLVPWTELGRQALYFMAIASVVAITFKLIYSFIGEKIECEILRRKSANVLVDTSIIPMVRQVSGPQRIGKDASAIGSCNIMREVLMVKDAQRMSDIRDKCYMIDFDKVHDYLDSLYNGKKFVQSSGRAVIRAFNTTMYQENCFFDDVFLKTSGVHPRKYLKAYMKFDQYEVQRDVDIKDAPDIPETYLDGITPGGKQYLDFLFEYFILYVRYVHIPNYVLSNQPIIEYLELDKKQRIQEIVKSKKFRQSMVSIKEDNSFPYIHSLITVETESAIMYGNTDKKHEVYVKFISGIREFLTLIGHLLGESCYHYYITQDPNRPIKAIRELVQIYLNVEGKKERCTSPTIRKFIGVFIWFHKVGNWFIEKFFEYSELELKELLPWLKNIITLPFKLVIYILSLTAKSSIMRDLYIKAKNRNRRLISRGKALQDRLNNKGYLEFQIAVHKSIRDIGKRVVYPKLIHGGVMLENEGERFEKRSFGLRLTMRKSDTWERYDTHFLRIIKDAKKEKHSETFMDLPEWGSMRMTDADIDYMEYEQLTDVMDPLREPQITFDNEDLRHERNMKILTELSVEKPKEFNKMIENAGLMKNTKVLVKKHNQKQRIPGKAKWNDLAMDELLWQIYDRGLFEKVVPGVIGPVAKPIPVLELIELVVGASGKDSIELRRILNLHSREKPIETPKIKISNEKERTITHLFQDFLKAVDEVLGRRLNKGGTV